MPEEEAFSVFVKLMEDYGMRPLFTPSMAHLNLCFYLLEHLMQVSTVLSPMRIFICVIRFFAFFVL